MAAVCSEAPCAYPLCLPRDDLDAEDLQSHHEDLVRRAPELFAADESSCDVEMREFTRPRPIGRTASANSTATCTQKPSSCRAPSSAPQTISKAEDLRASLSASTTSTPFLAFERPI